jgi:hypothetical protein
MMDLSEVIFDEDWYRVATIDRESGQYDEGGAWVVTWTRDTLECAIHPADAGAMQLLPEGERNLAGIKVYSVDPLLLRDLVYHKGETWRVAASANWSDYGFYDCTAVRLLESTKAALRLPQPPDGFR